MCPEECSLKLLISAAMLTRLGNALESAPFTLAISAVTVKGASDSLFCGVRLAAADFSGSKNENKSAIITFTESKTTVLKKAYEKFTDSIS
jgi:hypothetical protein